MSKLEHPELHPDTIRRHSFQEGRTIGLQLREALATIPEAQILLEEGLVASHRDATGSNESLMQGIIHGAVSRPISIVRSAMEERVTHE